MPGRRQRVRGPKTVVQRLTQATAAREKLYSPHNGPANVAASILRRASVQITTTLYTEPAALSQTMACRTEHRTPEKQRQNPGTAAPGENCSIIYLIGLDDLV